MPQLVALAYTDEWRAAEVIALLPRLRIGSTIDVNNVVGVVRRTDWGVILQHGMDLAEQGDCACKFWRPFIASLILAPGASSQRAHFADVEIDASFEPRLGAAMPPGSSAVFMIVPRRTLTRFADELNRLGGTLITTPIALGRIQRPPQATEVIRSRAG
jgi:uncharacterized membrane protein